MFTVQYSILNTQYSMFNVNVQFPMFNVQSSKFNVQCSFNVQTSMFNVVFNGLMGSNDLDRKVSQNGPMSTPKRPQDEPRGPKKRTRTTRRQENRTKTISRRLGPPRTLHTPVCTHPWGTIWEAKSAPKRHQKRCKNEAKNQEAKKPIQDDLGPILG